MRNMREEQMRDIREFLDDVKEGLARGDSECVRITDKAYLEASVGDFQYGSVNIRIWVEDDRIDAEEGLYFRRLQVFDSKYEDIQSQVTRLLNDVNETDHTIAFEPEIRYENRASKNPEIVPDALSISNSYAFDQFVQIRNDVSIAEAMMTNRKDGMTRTEVEDSLNNMNDDQ